MSKQSAAYVAFFLKNEEGQKFLKELDRLIDAEHEKAEKDADRARDYTQSARGVRLVQEHIQSVTAEVKK